MICFKDLRHPKETKRHGNDFQRQGRGDRKCCYADKHVVGVFIRCVENTENIE